MFSTDRALLISLLKTKNCKEISDVRATANYAELFSLILQFSGLFDCDPVYLGQILDLFSDAVLLANNIYYKKTGTTLNNPLAIVNSTYVTLNINAGGDYLPVEIMKGSIITDINVSDNTQLQSLVIGGGSSVNGTLTVAQGSCIDTVLVKGCNGFNSTLNEIIEGSCINDFDQDADAVFNGFVCAVP